MIYFIDIHKVFTFYNVISDSKVSSVHMIWQLCTVSAFSLVLHLLVFIESLNSFNLHHIFLMKVLIETSILLKGKTINIFVKEVTYMIRKNMVLLPWSQRSRLKKLIERKLIHLTIAGWEIIYEFFWIDPIMYHIQSIVCTWLLCCC